MKLSDFPQPALPSFDIPQPILPSFKIPDFSQHFNNPALEQATAMATVYDNSLNKFLESSSFIAMNAINKQRSAFMQSIFDNSSLKLASQFAEACRYKDQVLKEIFDAHQARIDAITSPFDSLAYKTLHELSFKPMDFDLDFSGLTSTDWSPFLEHLVGEEQIEQEDSFSQDEIIQASQVIQEEVHKAVAKATAGPGHDRIEELTTLVESLQISLEKNKTSRRSRITKRLVDLVINIVAGLAVSFIVILATPSISPPQAYKANLKSAKATIQQAEDSTLRIVNVNSRLNLRMKPNRKSLIIDKLPPLTCVKIIQTANKWALVCCQGPDGDIVAGWVFKKYLSK